jgi:hypothetical protein
MRIMRMPSLSSVPERGLQISHYRKELKSLSLVALMLMSILASIQYDSLDVRASSTTDQDGDGLTYGLEFLLNLLPSDPDSDNDGLPDGWEWKYGLDPLSSSNDDGALGDPDGDGMSNLQEYTYLMPTGWDNSATPTLLDNGVWWNGTVPVNDWDEENAMQYNRPACGSSGADGTGNTILCDEDPVGNICANGFDDDKDGLVDSADPDGDGDADCNSNDDDGDGIEDEDVAGWDTDGDGMPDGWEAANGLNATSASNADGPNGDPDGDGLNNLLEYVNPTWDSMCGANPCFRNGPDGAVTETTTPCDPLQGCLTFTAEVDGITSTNPQRADSDNDGLNDSYEALTLLTDPTSPDTDNDGINDGVEVNGQYGNPPQPSDPRNNNTDGDELDDGEEDNNSNGVIDPGETDPTRKEDSGDQDEDGIENWEENMSCTLWDVADSDFGGVDDGDELNVTHGTDPCDSFVNFETTIVGTSGSNILDLTDSSGFNPIGGVGWYNVSGTFLSFTYSSVVGQLLVGVSSLPSPGVTEVSNRNGSFCHTAAFAAGTLGTTQQYCDDDYRDSDGDGLADWEELLGTYGFFSNPSIVDTDADGVSDFDEVFDFTDPNEPCNNLLDDDSDNLNNYFEATIGCDLSWIGVFNGSQDVWATNSQLFDTDSGGVDDRTEYFDGTNPQNDPLDDILPEDFDGDGVPDAIENLTGTDWTNPDTDGGGMFDGDECPQAFWGTNCVGSGFDPLDPTDDIVSQGVVFWANNSTGVVDLNQTHRWTQNTFDFYTGTTYAHIATVHPFEQIVPALTNFTNLPDSSFSNGSVDWDITFNNSISRGNIPISSQYYNLSFWSDPSSFVSRSNDTHTIKLEGGLIDSLFLQQNEYFFDWDSIAANTVAGQNYPYESDFKIDFTNINDPLSIVYNITNDVITQSGVTSGYDLAKTLSDFLREGNDTFDFMRFHAAVGISPGDDIAQFIMENSYGQCSDYNAAFVTMARIAGLPARYVTGYSGGEWNGNGYTVSAQHQSSWGEVRLELTGGASNIDLGWVPFDSCPDAEELEIANQTLAPLTWDRDMTQNFTFDGQFRFTENTSVIENTELKAYLIPIEEVASVPGSAVTSSRLIGTSTTDLEGNFSFSGSPNEANMPGLHVIAIVHQSSGFVSNDAIIYSMLINVTDDSNLSHSVPLAVNSPVVGAGSLTILQGDLTLENDPNGLTDKFDSQLVWLSFTSSFNGSNNISGLISPSGSWSINLELDVTETIGFIPATLWYGGWVDDFSVPSNPTPQFHIRPSSLNLNLDVREAPNLTASIESLSNNNSRYVVGEDIWVNGSAVSAGLNPVDMEGDLILSIREAGSFDSWSLIFNTTVNGSFSVVRNLSASLANVPAGEIEFQLRFYPSSIDTTDDADLSLVDPFILISILDINIFTSPQIRGSIGAFNVGLTDHRGALVDFAEGNFDFSFNGSWYNTTTNSSGKMISSIIIDDDLVAGDYPIEVSYNGSELYAPSVSVGTIRIKATIGWSLTLAQDWTHIGNSTFINGSIFDELYNTPILGQNITQYTISMFTPDGIVDISQGLVNNNTSAFSQQIDIPTVYASSVYSFRVSFDFYTQGPTGGPYYAYEESFLNASDGNLSALPAAVIDVGIESELVLNVLGDREIENVVVTNGQFQFSILVTDFADNSFVPNEDVEFIFDWNGTNQSIGTARSNENGTANFSWTATGIAPGVYDIRVVAYDNISSPLVVGNTRHLGNSTFTNITVQGNTDFRIDSIPSSITAGLDFNVIGQVIDADDNSRLLISPVKLEVFWLNNPNETLVAGYTTTTNGSFNMTVPTDVLNNGTVRGSKTLVISVIEDSSPFYLESSLETPVFVFGVSDFDSLKPLNPIIVNRGDDVNLSGQLVESSNRFLPLSGYDVSVQLGETWIGDLQTNATGQFDLTYTIPTSNSLGLVTATFWFNGSSDLLSVNSNISTIIVRSQTFMLIDSITDNPIAGQSFNISGTILSDNGSGLEQSDGTVLPANILFSIDGQPTGFSVNGGAVRTGGIWNATITLTNSFAAGTHLVDASYTPAVNFYLGSNDTEVFDSRGFSELIFMVPTTDSQGQPTLNDRTERGNNISIELLLQDNTGSPVDGQQLIVTLVGTSITTTLTTQVNGSAFGELLVPSDQIVGVMDINAEFAGIPGTTGMIGSQTNTSFVVLAQTNLTIVDSPEGLVAGDYMLVNGTLLDDLSLPLQSMGVSSPAVVHLIVDGEPVASIETDAINGTFTLGWAVPEDISAGVHTIVVEFYGGRDWVDPIGFGEPSNPEYYLPSSDTVDFNVSVPTVLSLLTQSGDVNREELMVIEGLIVDIVNNPLNNLTLEVWLDGEFMTNVNTDSEGFFTAVYPVPADAELGPVSLEVRFTGTTFYLPSEANSTWNIFSHILVSVDIAETIAVGQNVSITGSVVDNQLIAIQNHSVDLIIEGIIISSVTTDSNGNFLFEWTVPDIFEFGNHTIFAYSESQGYYRANSSNASFFLAHRSDLTVIFDEGPDVTRGEIWVLSGRLFDFDSLTKEGLEGETIRILLDGNEIGTTSTVNNGDWEIIIPASMDLARGVHSFEIIFDGTNSHLGTNDFATGTVWADVQISIDQSSTPIVIRSDGTFGPIELTGSISEIGGTGEVFESITIFIGNGSDCVNQREGARCIASSLVNTQWSNGNFTISTIAPSWYQFGSQYIHLDTQSNDSIYINEATVSHPIFVQLNVDFDWEMQQVIPDEREEIIGSLTITANDTKAGVPGIEVIFILTNSSNGEVTSPLTVITDSNGVASFEFNSDPPFGDQDNWGKLSLDVQIIDPIISSSSKDKFELLRTESSFDPNYKSIEEASGQTLWIYLVVLLISALIAGGVVVYRRRIAGELLQEAAEVFAYTAELLAAGDSIRETIFNCYQNLCTVLQQNGFLRRDFETVREFEVAIRQAMPEISDDALSAIDNMFEMARYSREELGPQHQAAAQQALERMSQEIGTLANIPTR